MSQPNFDQNNPYQAPAPVPVVTPSPQTGAFAKLLKDFQSQIVALGAFWIIIGGVTVAIGLFATSMLAGELDQQALRIVGVIVCAMGAVWMALGVFSCLKHMWAVYVGLGLSYLSVISNLFNFNLCGMIILVIVIIQAHRVISWAGQLKRAGIPLTARPGQLAIQSRPLDLS